MGTFSYPITIIGPDGEAALEPLVDTGATYSVAPSSVLRRIGVVPFRTMPFALADERVVEFGVGSLQARIDGQTMPTLCVFGTDEMEPLLGALTLEAFLLTVDPVHKRLVPVNGKLKRSIHLSGS